jgi:glycosyltransferase involved in cell wall biosynthesis
MEIFRRPLRKPIHVCIITCAHSADDVRVSHKIGQAFRSEGFRVTWVGPDNAFYDPDHYDRYGIEYRLFSPGKGKLGRLLRYFNAYRYGLLVPDVHVFYAPDPDSAAAAVRLAKKCGARVIFDIHEIYHEAMLGHWLKGPAAKIAGSLLQATLSRVCSRCDLVMGVSQSVLEPYRATPTEKMVVRNLAPAWFAEGDPADVCGAEKRTFTFMHGKAGYSRGDRVVLEALSLAKKQIGGLKCIMFDVFQVSTQKSGKDEFHRQVASLKLQDVVELRQVVPMQEMPAVLRTCDAGLIAYDRRLGADSFPNRLFEYMAAGLPVIVPSYSSEICRIIEAENCGLTVDFENPAALAETMVHLYQNPQTSREMGRRAREAFEKRLNWKVEVQPLLDRIQSWYPDGANDHIKKMP